MKNLISFIIFLVICIISFSIKDFNLFESASETMKIILGTPPPAFLVSISLAVYAFSSGFLTLVDISNNKKPEFKLTHLGYRSIFFMFYCFSGAIAVNFIPVLIVGVCLYGLDQTHITLYNSKIESTGLINH